MYLLLAACASSRTSSQGSLLVHVNDEQGSGLPTASVTVSGFSGVTGTGGIALFQPLPAGTYSVDATIAGFRSCGPMSVKVTGGHETSIEVLMRVGAIVDGVGVAGTRFDPCPGRPHSGVFVDNVTRREVPYP
jgi:hypothetical protein